MTPFTGSPSTDGRYYLVLFEDAEPKAGPRAGAKPAIQDKGENARLQRELVATREYLQSIIADHAGTMEKLRAANEEAQAGNEELETAQEELESANEELNTLNEELKISNVEFSKVNRDLTNLLESISIPLVMVGRDLRIRRFTRAIEPMLNLIASDVGRSISDLQPQMELPDLRRLLLDAMEGGNRQPRDIRDAHGRWYSLRILPSVGPDGKTDGAVLMLIDIDAAKRGLDFAEAIVETVREPLVILNQNLQVIQANKTFYETFQAAREETEGRLIYDLGNGQWNIPKLRELLENILPAHATFRDFEVTHEFEHVGRKVMLLNASEIFNPNAQARTILLAIEDATDRKQAEEALRTTNAELQHFAYALTHDLQEPLRMVVNFTELLGREYAGKMGEEADQFISYSVEGALRIEALLKALLAYWEVTEREQNGFAPIDCGAVLAKALLNLQAAIAQSGAIVTSDPLPTVVAEEVMLIQLFQNLISNSIKYRGEEAPESMSRRRETRKDGCLRCGTTESESIRKTPTGCSACSNDCTETKSPVPALVWRCVRRLSSARVDGSGWNRNRARALHSSSPFPRQGGRGGGLKWRSAQDCTRRNRSLTPGARSGDRAPSSPRHLDRAARNLKSLSRWRLTTCASLCGTWPHTVN